MPVLKVKKNGVWEPVGGMSGGSGGSSDSGLPEYSEEDYGKVLTPSADGLVWAEQSNGSDDSSEIPFFDLGEMGLPAISFDGTLVSANVDCTEIRTALAAGPVKITFNIDWNGNIVPFTMVTNALYIPAEDNYQVGIVQTMIWNGVPVVKTGSFNFFTNKITSRVLPIQKELPAPTESDIGKVLTVTEDGLVWTEQNGGSWESEYFTVTWDFSAEASHSHSEIEAAINEGKRPRLVMAGMEHLEPLYFEGSENGISRFSCVSYVSDIKTVIITAIHIDDKKKVTFTQEEGKLVPTPSESDYSKILSATADGLVWVDANTLLPDVEEATF